MLRASDLSVLEGRKSFRCLAPLAIERSSTELISLRREAFVEQMHSIDSTLEECAAYQCMHSDLDAGFAEFYEWAKACDIPVIVLSAGLQPLIRALIARLLGPEVAAEIEIISNEAVAWKDPDQSTRRDWQVKLHDNTEYGMYKSSYIQAYAYKHRNTPDKDRPVILFAGDGVSDLSAAKSADVLFAKADKDLVVYCEREQIPFKAFKDWKDILTLTKSIK